MKYRFGFLGNIKGVEKSDCIPFYKRRHLNSLGVIGTQWFLAPPLVTSIHFTLFLHKQTHISNKSMRL